jgi:hypothetical protein
MKAINLTVGFFFAYGLSKVPKDQSSAYNARLTEAAEKVVDACAKAPEARYFDTFAELMKK